MNSDLLKGQTVYLAKNVRPYARGIGVVKGEEYRVVDTYDFQNAVRIRALATGVESLVTRAELVSDTAVEAMLGAMHAAREEATRAQPELTVAQAAVLDAVRQAQGSPARGEVAEAT